MVRKILGKNIKIKKLDGTEESHVMYVAELEFRSADKVSILELVPYSKEMPGIEFFGTDILLSEIEKNIFRIRY